MGDLFLHQGQARVRRLAVHDDPVHWYELGEEDTFPLSQTDVVLMRKDLPFDMEYIYATYLVELAEAAGVLVVNAPQGLRDANETLFTAWFRQCCPESLVTRAPASLSYLIIMPAKAGVQDFVPYLDARLCGNASVVSFYL